jgi:hypothetical protein
LEKLFFKTFSAENSIFPNILGGKFSAEFSLKFSPEKMYEKSAPDFYYLGGKKGKRKKVKSFTHLHLNLNLWREDDRRRGGHDRRRVVSHMRRRSRVELRSAAR